MIFKVINYVILLVAIVFGMCCFYFKQLNENQYDLIIIGTGIAGLSAAYESYNISNGTIKILLVEKEPSFGGNSMKATSGINILNTPVQQKANAHDSSNLFYEDTMVSGKNISSPQLVSTLVTDSTDVYSFFTKLGADLSQLGLLGGHSVARTHRPEKLPVGYALTTTLFKKINQLNHSITYANYTTVFDLIYDKEKNHVSGIILGKRDQKEIKSVKAKAVILATGGFAHDFNDQSLLKEFTPHLINFPTTNGPEAEGLGMKMGRRIGAQLIDMKEVQLHPTGFVDLKDRYTQKKMLAPELLRGVGGILLNQDGKRFCNELGPRDYVTAQILAHCKKQPMKGIDQTESFLIINQKGYNEFGKSIEFYVSKGLMKSYTSFKEFSTTFSLNYEEISKTLDEYNKNADEKKDKFGKKSFPYKFDINENIYAGIITPSLHYTMGGLKINNETKVLNTAGTIIKGLFAAGEVTGGVHGGNRLGGNSLSECAVFGRKAARSAIKYIKQ